MIEPIFREHDTHPLKIEAEIHAAQTHSLQGLRHSILIVLLAVEHEKAPAPSSGELAPARTSRFCLCVAIINEGIGNIGRQGPLILPGKVQKFSKGFQSSLFQSVLGGQAQFFDSVQSIDSLLIVPFGGSFLVLQSSGIWEARKTLNPSFRPKWWTMAFGKARSPSQIRSSEIG